MKKTTVKVYEPHVFNQPWLVDKEGTHHPWRDCYTLQSATELNYEDTRDYKANIPVENGCAVSVETDGENPQLFLKANGKYFKAEWAVSENG